MNSKKEKNSDEQFSLLLSSLKSETIAPDSKFLNELREQSAKEFQDSALYGSASSDESTNIIFRRIIMKSRLTKLAVAAAVIVLVVLVGLPFLRNKGTGVVLANVLAKVEQAKAFMYRMKMTMTVSMLSGMPARTQEMQGVIIISNEYGMKMEMDMTDPSTGKKITQQMYFVPDQKIAVSVIPEMKRYMQMEFDDDLLARTKKQNNDPRERIKQIMSSEYKQLGRSVIDGVEVEGFQASDSPLFGGSGSKVTLWVDAEKWLPVRMEIDLKIDENMQATGVIYGYRWDIAVQREDFQPVIPEDFTALTQKPIQVPSGDEQGAIEGLKFFAEILGKYPKDLNMIALMKEFSAMEHSQNLTEAGLKLKEEMESLDKEKNIEKTMNMILPVQSLSMFYMRLVQDKKEPVYYGESVGPNDGDKVLLRWKVSDSQYRVIFGNLTTADVTAEKLAELEKLLSK